MRNRRFTQADVLLVFANLLPVYGVWFLGWNAIEAFVVYAMETLLTGILTLLKMTVVTLYRGKDNWYNEGRTTRVSGLVFLFFFTAHYGLFAAVQTSIFAETANIIPSGKWPLYFFFHWYSYINRDIAYMLTAFVVSYFARSFVPFIVRGEYKCISLMRLMFQPYGRIFIQQFTVILGSMLLSLGIEKGFILVFALVKTWFDLYVNFDNILDKSLEAMEGRQEKAKETGRVDDR